MAAVLGWAVILAARAFGTFVIWSAPLGAGWEPTSRKKVRRMLDMSGAGPSDVVYDLGSGDGRVLVEAAKNYRARAVGVEADPIRVLISRAAVAVHHLEGRATVVWGNFFHVDLSEATIVTLFLSQGANQKLKPKLLSELRPGTRIVSHEWTFDDWKPASTDEAQHLAMYVVQ